MTSAPAAGAPGAGGPILTSHWKQPPGSVEGATGSRYPESGHQTQHAFPWSPVMTTRRLVSIAIALLFALPLSAAEQPPSSKVQVLQPAAGAELEGTVDVRV